MNLEEKRIFLSESPYPVISETTENHKEIFTDKKADFSKRITAGNPIFNINKIIQEDFSVSCEKKNEDIYRGSAGLMEIMQDFKGLRRNEETLKMALEVQKPCER